MTRARFIIGIDLGTTNCALAYVDTRGKERPSADIRVFDVPQLVAAGETAPRAMLPSFLYLPGPHELPAEAAHLPWREDADRIVGEFARIQGARVPHHLVSSGKSWLCQSAVDREADILPWGVPINERRVSPVEAAADYLRHMRDAWNWAMAHDDDSARLELQEIVLTVPASFDEAARELTVEAARRAGFASLTLIEEPQAAFYCWIVTHQDGWQAQVRAGERILVCDIGGGTTDFSLITVVETPSGPGFRRVAVGDHLLLGGDNMDLALAHLVEKRLGNVRLDAEQWSALRFACRTAKEKLLADNTGHARWAVTIAGRGSKLIGGSLQAELTRDDVATVVLDGFFPLTSFEDAPHKAGRTGLQEFGLPYESDSAIPRHLSAFLRRHQETLPAGIAGEAMSLVRPDAILFNGGALTPSVLRERIVAQVADWFHSTHSAAPRVLVNESLDLAVAIGAAYYGVVRRGGGIRIGGGTSRSIYVGVEPSSENAADNPWLCVVPRDAQEGDELEITGNDFELMMDQPVAFPLASSSVRATDKPGDLVADDPDTLLPLPPLVGVMRVGRKAKAERVPVRLAARVTEVGTVELWCHSRTDDRRWRLQIQFRASATPARTPVSSIAGSQQDSVVLEQAVIERAIDTIRVAMSSDASDGNGPNRLLKNLESALGLPKDQWPPSALRAMWEPLHETSEVSARSPRHEARWMNLAGYCLRPGTGFPLDEARIKALWPLWHGGVNFSKDTQCWVEWWVLWRRVAAGLNRAHHEEIYRRISTFLIPTKGVNVAKKANRPKPEPHELSEMWRCAASLERLAAVVKESLGQILARTCAQGEVGTHGLWCLGRLGARVPLFGSTDTVVPPEACDPWLESAIAYQPRNARERIDLVFALTQMARVSGDRVSDFRDEPRYRVIDRLKALGADEAAIQPVREYHELAASQQTAALGDALPAGLRLVVESTSS